MLDYNIEKFVIDGLIENFECNGLIVFGEYGDIDFVKVCEILIFVV